MPGFLYSRAVPGDKFPVGTVVKLFTSSRPEAVPETGVVPTTYSWLTDTGLTATVDSAGNLAFTAELDASLSYVLGQLVSSQWRYLLMPQRARTGVDGAGQQAVAKTAQGAATIGAASAAVVPANPARTGVYVANTHATQDAYLSLGGTAVSGQGIYLKAAGGAVYIADFTGAINGIAAGASTVITYAEV